MRVRSYGLRTGPAKDAAFVLVMPNASSCRLVLPSTIAPASRSRCSDGASAAGRACRSAGVPPVVGMSRVLMLSLTTIGRPASGGSGRPAARSSSTRRAARSAPASSRWMKALRSDCARARSSSALT
jgi:hypothetical protein